MVRFAEGHDIIKKHVNYNTKKVDHGSSSDNGRSASNFIASKNNKNLEHTTIERKFVRIVKTQNRDGQIIYAKYPLDKTSDFDRFLRKVTTTFIKNAFWRPLPFLTITDRNKLEATKLKKYQSLGLAVPEILAEHDGFNIFVDIGKNIEEILNELRPRDVRLHDILLTRCAEALGQVHAAGLCQGRLDLQDMYLAQHGVGFSGFQEFPEKNMPIRLAQVRDIWFLLNLVTTKAVDKDKVLATSFMAWRKQVGLETLETLRTSVRSFRFSLKPHQIFTKLFASQASQDKLRVMRFLVSNLGV